MKTKFLAGIAVWLLVRLAAGDDSAVASWEWECLHLQDGEILRGVILEEQKHEIRLAQIFLTPGKPMFAVARWVPRSRIERLQKPPLAERIQLRERFEKFRHRTRIEARRLEKIELQPGPGEGGFLWTHSGHNFFLKSTVDDELTRRCVVRIEQIFLAYQQILPPRIDNPPQIRGLLFGSMAQYRQQMKRWGLELENPAFYSPEQNLLAAGGDLHRYSLQWRQAREQSREVRQQYETWKKEFPRKLAARAAALRRRGYRQEEIDDELRLCGSVWRRELKAKEEELKEIERRNENRFRQITEQMFRRLSHEAFHAYLETHVYPHNRCDFPRWLNEGLAQVFESGRLEAGSLRIGYACLQ